MPWHPHITLSTYQVVLCCKVATTPTAWQPSELSAIEIVRECSLPSLLALANVIGIFSGEL